jgi:hypothetical protein
MIDIARLCYVKCHFEQLGRLTRTKRKILPSIFVKAAFHISQADVFSTVRPIGVGQDFRNSRTELPSHRINSEKRRFSNAGSAGCHAIDEPDFAGIVISNYSRVDKAAFRSLVRQQHVLAAQTKRSYASGCLPGDISSSRV